MTDPNKAFVTNINKQNFNLLLFFNLFVAFLGSLFLAWKDVKAGEIYSWMFVGTTALIFLVFFFIKDDNSLRPITDYIKIPFAVKPSIGVFFYMVGIALPFLVKLLLALSGAAFNVTDLSVPLFGQEISESQFQSFSTAEVGNSMPWRIFTLMFVAGNVETYAYNFGLVLLGVLIGVFIWQLLSDGEKWGFVSKKAFIVGFSLLLSMVFFILSHLLNDSYQGAMFLVAGIFLLVSNLAIYLFGVFLTFWAGYHQSNNLLYLIDQHGLKVVFTEGFVSWFGLIYTLYVLLLVYFLLRKMQSGELTRDLKTWFSS